MVGLIIPPRCEELGKPLVAQLAQDMLSEKCAGKNGGLPYLASARPPTAASC